MIDTMLATKAALIIEVCHNLFVCITPLHILLLIIALDIYIGGHDSYDRKHEENSTY